MRRRILSENMYGIMNRPQRIRAPVDLFVKYYIVARAGAPSHVWLWYLVRYLI